MRDTRSRGLCSSSFQPIHARIQPEARECTCALYKPRPLYPLKLQDFGDGVYIRASRNVLQYKFALPKQNEYNTWCEKVLLTATRDTKRCSPHEDLLIGVNQKFGPTEVRLLHELLKRFSCCYKLAPVTAVHHKNDPSGILVEWFPCPVVTAQVP